MKRVKMFLGAIVLSTGFAFAQETNVSEEMQAAIEKAAARRLAEDKAVWEAAQRQEQLKAFTQDEINAAGSEAGKLRETEDAMNYASTQHQLETQASIEAQAKAEADQAIAKAADERILEDMIRYSIQKNYEEVKKQISEQMNIEIQAAVEEAAKNRIYEDAYSYYKSHSLEFYLEAQKQAAIENAANDRFALDSINYMLAQYQIALQKSIEAQIASEIQAAIEKAARERFAEDSANWARYQAYNNIGGLKSEKADLSENEVAVKEIKVSVYPNPAVDYINVEIVSSDNSYEDGTSEIAIMDLTGMVVWKSNVQNNNMTIDLTSIHSGYYLVQYSGNNKQVAAKFIKQ